MTDSALPPHDGLEGTVLVTGGTGFIGRALLRRAARGWPARLLVTSRDPATLSHTLARFPSARGVVADLSRVEGIDAVRRALAEERVTTVIHGAAVKSVPDAERDVHAAVELNVIGSERVARAATEAGVATVVGISSDKACAPAGVYGLTKALMERTFAEHARASATRFVTVRCGNVAGAGGSVVPLFRKTLAEAGRVTLTDPKMTRFWLSADDAVALVVAGAALAREVTGATLLARYPAMTIGDVAQAVWLEQGGTGDVPVTVIGKRPGEKLSDELWNDAEAPRLVEWGRYLYLRPPLDGPAASPVAETHYGSEGPARWLSVAEMRAIIRDADGL